VSRAVSHSEQLAFDLSHRPAFGAEDFYLSKSNELAVRLMDDWPNWGQYGQILAGPAASGKTHLINVWRLQAKATILLAKDLQRSTLQHIETNKVICIEDVDHGLLNGENLFHLLNRVKEQGGHVLLSTRVEVSQLPITLTDLRSRLLALPCVSINAPDDALLRAVMIKQFADRQIKVDPQLVEYLFKRMERSMQAVSELVGLLDRGALRKGRALTRPLAREILANRVSS